MNCATTNADVILLRGTQMGIRAPSGDRGFGVVSIRNPKSEIRNRMRETMR